jgi:hypothetical protein
MALLVHHSFPDEFELANGVATLTKLYGSTYDVLLVTQLGAVSVANPTDGSIPEEVSVYASTYGTYPTLVRASNLVPLGATVLEWQSDYLSLCDLLVGAAQQFETVTGKTGYTLDFEYKKLSPGGAAMPAGGLAVKQIRELPQPDTTPTITPFLINEPTEFSLFQGEYADIWANHRLKCRWSVETESFWLTEESLSRVILSDVEFDYVEQDRARRLSGGIELWPFASHTSGKSPYADTHYTADDWFMHHIANPRQCQLQIEYIPAKVSAAQSPLLTIRDLSLYLRVDYNEPVPTLSWPGPTTLSDTVSLGIPIEAQEGELLQQRSIVDEVNGISISTTFYWPVEPTGAVAGYTAPLARWVETVITGYTTEPIVLHGYYSQTYRPEHHNFSEHFMFEPRLEPGISQTILDELKAADIRLIYALSGYVEPQITTYGFDAKPFYPGDINGSGEVDLRDYTLLAQRWLDSVCDECGGADLTGDGAANFEDVKEIACDWLSGVN